MFLGRQVFLSKCSEEMERSKSSSINFKCVFIWQTLQLNVMGDICFCGLLSSFNNKNLKSTSDKENLITFIFFVFSIRKMCLGFQQKRYTHSKNVSFWALIDPFDSFVFPMLSSDENSINSFIWDQTNFKFVRYCKVFIKP